MRIIFLKFLFHLGNKSNNRFFFISPMSKNLISKIKDVGKKSIITGMIAASTFYSCSKDDSIESYVEPVVAEKELKENTKILSDDDLNSVSNYEDSKIYFTKPMDYSVGDIIVGGVGEKSPYGFLEKVSSISIDKKSFSTTDVSISEAINNGEFVFSKRLTVDDLSKKQSNKIVQSKTSGYEFSYPIENAVVYDFDGNLDTTGDQIRVSGEVLFNAELNAEAKFEKKLEYFHFEVGVDVDSNLEIKCGNKSVANNIDEKVVLYNEYFTPFTVLGPGFFPLVIVPNIEIEAGVVGDLSGEVTSNIGAEANLKNKLKYEFSDWSNDTESRINFNYESPESYVKTGIKGYVEPKLSFLVYGGAGPFVSIENYLKLNIDSENDPWWELDAGIAAKVGADMGIFDKSIPGYEKVIWEHEKRVAEATEPMEELVWKEDFEDSNIGSFPVGWYPDANANARSKNKIIDENGNKILQLYGVVGGCWGALTYKNLETGDSYKISLDVKNDKNNNNGCHTGRAAIGLREGMSWKNKSEAFCYFDKSGRLYSKSGNMIANTDLGEWQNVEIRYFNGDSPKLIYYLNKEKIWEENRKLNINVNNLELVVQEGTAYFDNVEVKKIN